MTTPTLKDETIKGLQLEGMFDMSDFGQYQNQRRPKKTCGTSCCVAGHIVLAASRLGRKLPTYAEVNLKYNSATDRCESKLHALLEKKGLKLDDNETAQAARLVWARAYGVESANALDFYADGPEMAGFDNWNLDRVPPSAAIQHLNRVAKIK